MTSDRRNLIIWLASVCIVVYLMIIVGGVTRLTQSGLSMVDWQPVTGIIPPITDQEWQQEFSAYKQYPEYQKINRGMSLDEFKGIFFWEYSHRVLGRVIGMIFFIPFVIFLMLGKIERQFRPRLWIALVLGGLQGLMGWYMVKSGLVDEPRVSHYRLAAHLLLAVAILVFLFWLILDMAEVRRAKVSPAIRWLGSGLSVLLFLQLLFGAFTAGLDAGYGFNTYPLMHGQFLADAAVMMQPFWHNLIENGVMTQFLHRWLGALLLLGVGLLSIMSLRAGVLVWPIIMLAIVTLTQFLLGVATLLLSVPVGLGSAHQAIACLMVLAMVLVVYSSRGSE
jgi:cytochrome c oxidase assembly protein subunit 15